MFAPLMEKLSLGIPSSHRNLTLTPILAIEPLLAIELKSLEEALADGTVKVTEVSAEGHVPELRVKNSGVTPVLILDGEELVGAKQNRIVNVTVLVPPNSEIVIPVSCIEAGRWAYSRPGFAAAGRVLNQKICSRKAESVSKNLKEHRSHFSDQGAVWDGVSAALCSLAVASPTQSLSDAYDLRANAIDGFLEAFRPNRGRSGSSAASAASSPGSISWDQRPFSRAHFRSSRADRLCRLLPASTRMAALPLTMMRSSMRR